MIGRGIISQEHIVMIATAIMIGTLSRFLTLKEDYRQYPSYPNGYLIHAVTGFVAAALGAVAIPALMTNNFIAVTFLTLAVQQFREVRKMEHDSLKDLENTEFTQRGDAYIDGISKTFESRNYLSLLVALFTSIMMQTLHFAPLFWRIAAGTVAGLLTFWLLKTFTKGLKIEDIAGVESGEVEVRGSELYVDRIFVTNLLGTDNARTLFSEQGIAAVVRPKALHNSIILDNFGQRQAMLFEAARAVGMKRYHYTRKDFENGAVVVALVPIHPDRERMLSAVRHTPVLESLKKQHRLISLWKSKGGD